MAQRLRRALGGDLFTPERWRPPFIEGGTHVFGAGGIRAALADSFQSYRKLVLVMPIGIAVRAVAPLIQDKHVDPAVVVVDEAGAHAIALLSGHLGGANELAREVASALGARPVITTAAEVLGAIPLDLLGHQWGWTIEEIGRGSLTRASAALIGGEPIGGYQDAGEEEWWREAPSHLVRHASIESLLAAPVAARIVVSDRVLPPFASPGTGDPALVVFRPKSLVVGIGCVRGAAADELGELVQVGLQQGAVVLASVRELATIDLKHDEEGLTELAARHGWSIRFFAAAELAAVAPPSGGSATVERSVGALGVCEPAALLATGTTDLVVPKVKSARATVAVARIHTPVSQGRLTIVGLGPGTHEDLTERARHALESAQAVVGYHAYLDLVRPWLGQKAYHGSAIGDERERAQLAIALTRAGQRVALVSSGDAGIYGMAGLVFELLEGQGDAGLADAVEVIPGVSAAQAAAALLGAPLMSDYVSISLSDLLTPWGTIEARLHAAAASDLVVALYNPASQRRREQLVKAREILLGQRPPATPVGLVRNASRAGQETTITDLGHLLDHRVDMLTIVIVGNSATVPIGSRITTRRGYPRAQITRSAQ